VLGELRHNGGDRRLLLADGDVEAVNALPLLVDDRVEGDGGLADLAVADDELTLATADRDHGVDRLDAGLERLFDRLALEDARRLDFHAALVGALDGALAVDRETEGVDDAAHERLADGDVEDAAGALDFGPFLDAGRVAEDGGADVVGFEVEDEAHQAARELKKLAGHGPFEAVDAGDTVADREDRPGLVGEGGLLVVLDLLLDDLGDLFGAKLHGGPCTRVFTTRGRKRCVGRSGRLLKEKARPKEGAAAGRRSRPI